LERGEIKGEQMKTFEELFVEIMTSEYGANGTGTKRPPDWFMEDYLEQIIKNMVRDVKEENKQ
jgi:hypothetical protein